MTNQIVSKCGIHNCGDRRKDYLQFVQTIDASGRKLSVVKCRDNFGAVDEPLALWPDMLTIGAMTAWDDAGYNVQEAYSRIVEAHRLNPKIKYWEYFNERNGDYKEQADFYIDLMELLDHAGIGLCMFNCAKGTPQYDHIDPEPYAQIARACKVAKDGGYDVILGLHEYNGVEQIGRFDVLADYLEAHDALIPIVITEYGFETFPGDDVLLDFVEAHDIVYMSDPRVLGCALWTLGGGGWQGSNFETALPELAQYISTVEAIKPPARAYDRVCHLVPPSVDYLDGGNLDLRYLQIVRLAAPGRESIFASADDAFAVVPECKSRKVYVYNSDEWGGADALEAWVKQYYAPLPTIIYRTV